MIDALAVILDGQIAGTVIRSNDRNLRFEYDEHYSKQLNSTPLSVTMPTSITSHPHSVITPWLWGLLPEDQIVIDRWARKFQVSPSSPFELLKTPIGEDCPGAIRIAPPNQAERIINASSGLIPLSEEQVGDRLRDLLKDSSSWLGEFYDGRFSLAGAQAKTALVETEDGWALPSGSMATTHILKPGISGFQDHAINE
ncbi:MAG: HipA N-terminal domain-containing protein [Actinomycetota bacterium]|nr:HipA N-terminal domain-containing protein [Actinomycetota bacterium]